MKKPNAKEHKLIMECELSKCDNGDLTCEADIITEYKTCEKEKKNKV